MIDLSYAKAATLLLPETSSWRFVLIGCGGTGSWLAPSIARIACELREREKQVEIIFCDPDRVEEKNIPRQNFCRAEIGENKARTLAGRYAAAWGIEITAIPQPFETLSHFSGTTILIGCVDNAAGRKAIAKMLDMRRGDRHWWLDCGNSDEAGQVLFGNALTPQALAAAGQTTSRKICGALPAPSLVAPDLLVPRPEERLARRRSCAEVAAVNFQSLAINQQVAAIATDYLLRITGGGLKRFGTWFDLAAGSMRSRYNTPEELAGFQSKERRARGAAAH